MKRYIILALLILVSANAKATGIDCNALPAWSDPIDGFQVNQHHVFCGEPGKNSSAKGFHSTPNNESPTSYISSTSVNPPNRAGIYTLRQIKLSFNGKQYVKSFSSLFPSHCSQAQVNKSIVYSIQNKTGSCADPNWASCGPNAPAEGGADYCVGTNGAPYTIASALLSGTQKINTGFPIYKP